MAIFDVMTPFLRIEITKIKMHKHSSDSVDSGVAKSTNLTILHLYSIIDAYNLGARVQGSVLNYNRLN